MNTGYAVSFFTAKNQRTQRMDAKMRENTSSISPMRILLTGVGGQGVITAARILAEAAFANGHHVVVGELHGMAQRGGAVQSSVLIDTGYGSIIPRGGADVVLGFEPIETARTTTWISRKTLVIANVRPVVPFVLTITQKRYPETSSIWESLKEHCNRLVTFDATDLAIHAGSARTLSVVMLGLLAGMNTLPFDQKELWKAIENLSPYKYIEQNRKAFQNGLEASSSTKA